MFQSIPHQIAPMIKNWMVTEFYLSSPGGGRGTSYSSGSTLGNHPKGPGIDPHYQPGYPGAYGWMERWESLTPLSNKQVPNRHGNLHSNEVINLRAHLLPHSWLMMDNCFILCHKSISPQLLLQFLNHPPHRYPLKSGQVLLYSPCLFGKKLFSKQDKLVNNK